jgi:hypothetical protein
VVNVKTHVGWTCIKTDWKNSMRERSFYTKPQTKDNIKMALDSRCEITDSTELAQDEVQHCDFYFKDDDKFANANRVS